MKTIKHFPDEIKREEYIIVNNISPLSKSTIKEGTENVYVLEYETTPQVDEKFIVLHIAAMKTEYVPTQNLYIFGPFAEREDAEKKAEELAEKVFKSWQWVEGEYKRTYIFCDDTGQEIVIIQPSKTVSFQNPTYKHYLEWDYEGEENASQ